MARALEVPLYNSSTTATTSESACCVQTKISDDGLWGSSGKDAKYLNKLRRLLGKATEDDRRLILYTLQKMAR